MNNAEIKAMIRRHEGFKPYVYKDSLGNLTIGYGHLLAPGSPMPRMALEIVFEDDFKKAVAAFDVLGLAHIKRAARAVVIDMLFNMGSLSGWPRFLAALKAGNYELAALEMKWKNPGRQHLGTTDWYRQTGGRARELITLMQLCAKGAP
jgi:lysozyme